MLHRFVKLVVENFAFSIVMDRRLEINMNTFISNFILFVVA